MKQPPMQAPPSREAAEHLLKQARIVRRDTYANMSIPAQVAITKHIRFLEAATGWKPIVVED